MTTLEKAIAEFAEPHFVGTRTWFNWDFPDLPLTRLGVVIKANSSYDRNVELKQKLQGHWRRERKDRNALVQYYVSTWGGIRRNKRETMELYAVSTAAGLMKRGTVGIASWSKVLCMHDPRRFAIFDARVSVALNAVQVLCTVERPALFPALPSQNKSITAAAKAIRKKGRDSGWDDLPGEKCYRRYLQILRAAARDLHEEIYAVEMLLFAKAPSLAVEVTSKLRASGSTDRTQGGDLLTLYRSV